VWRLTIDNQQPMIDVVRSATALCEQCHNLSKKALAMKQFRGMSQT
jgi:hypothetical protein